MVAPVLLLSCRPGLSYVHCENNIYTCEAVAEDCVAQKNFNDALATSYFKMGKLYPEHANGAQVNHAVFDVRPQRCQVRPISLSEKEPLCAHSMRGLPHAARPKALVHHV